MKSIKVFINPPGAKSSISVNIEDLRGKNHPESDNETASAIQKYINEALEVNGYKPYDSLVYDSAINSDDNLIKISPFEHYYRLLGEFKGILKHRFKFGISSFKRYQKHHFESLDLLKNHRTLIKYNRNIYWSNAAKPRLELINYINSLCQGISNPTVLEAGCGSGLNMYLLNCLNSKIQLKGFEYTNIRLASAIANFADSTLRNNLFLADVCDLNLENQSYDIVYSNHVLEQLGQERATQALKEMWRVSRKAIILCEPTLHDANTYERWRTKILGYCEDLLSTAKLLPHSKITLYKEGTYRYYPNTSHCLIVERI